jgi:hypothetical protein
MTITITAFERSPDGADELVAFLAAFPTQIGKLFLAARRVILAAAPDASELVYDACNAVSAAYSYSSGLLAGSGRKIRHVRLLHPSDLHSPGVEALIRAAVLQGRALAPGGRATKPSSTVRPTTGTKRRPKRTR